MPRAERATSSSKGRPAPASRRRSATSSRHNIALGRRVLFVSEKMAALDVVYERLKKCGLGDFCLELHSAKANKKAVIDQLGAAWTSRKTFTPVEWEAKAAELARTRASLNAYVEALHAPGPSGISARQAIGRVLACGDIHRLELDWARDATGQGRAPTPAALRDLEELAARLDRAFAAIDPEDVAAFRDISQTEWSFAWSRQLVGEAKAFATAAAELRAGGRRPSPAVSAFDAPARTVAETAALADIARLVPDAHRQDFRFALDADGREALTTLGELGPMLAEYRRARDRVAAAYPDDRIAAAPIAAWLAARDRAAGRMWPFGALATTSAAARDPRGARPRKDGGGEPGAGPRSPRATSRRSARASTTSRRACPPRRPGAASAPRARSRRSPSPRAGSCARR